MQAMLGLAGRRMSCAADALSLLAHDARTRYNDPCSLMQAPVAPMNLRPELCGLLFVDFGLAKPRQLVTAHRACDLGWCSPVANVPHNHPMPCRLQDSLDGLGRKRGQACWRFVQLVSAAAVAALLILGIVG